MSRQVRGSGCQIFIVLTIAILPTALSFAALSRVRPTAGSVLTSGNLGGVVAAR
jgi:amino acid transporter